MNLDIRNIDESKADFGLRHEYIPQVDFNLKLDEKDRIVVDCEHFALGERTKFSNINKEGEISLDFPKIFLKKVKGIRNLTINGKPVTTAETVMKYPSVPALEALVTDVVFHITRSDELTEDETKN